MLEDIYSSARNMATKHKNSAYEYTHSKVYVRIYVHA